MLGIICSSGKHLSMTDTGFATGELRIGTEELKEESEIRSVALSGGFWKVHGAEQAEDNISFGLTAM